MIVYADMDFKSDSINYPAVKRPAGFDDTLSKAMMEPDYQKRAPLLMAMEKMMYDDVFQVPLWNVWDIEVRPAALKWDPSVRRNLEAAQGDRLVHFEFGWLDR